MNITTALTKVNLPKSITSINKPKFSLGVIGITYGVIKALPATLTSSLCKYLLHKHQTGDWGQLDWEDYRANNVALERGGRIFSSYRVGTVTVWIITERDRSATTILLPSEY